MFSPIDQLTTVVSATIPMPESWETSELYFHFVLQTGGAALSDNDALLLRKFLAGFARRKGSNLRAFNVAGNRIHLLVGLSSFSAPGAFVRELKLVSNAFLRRRLGFADFDWHAKYDAFTVSLSQIERVASYIRRQSKLDSQESYAASWNRLHSIELY